MEAVRSAAKIGGHALEVLPDAPPFGTALLNGFGLRGLHCGSGLNLHAGWLNTDRLCLINEAGHASVPDRLTRIGPTHYYLEHDHTYSLPVADGVFAWVYAEHFIEHITLDEAVCWLAEVRRVLKVGGLLRLSTPDLRRYAVGYVNGADDFFARHRQQLLSMGVKEVPTRPAWMMNQIFRFWGHQWIYDLDEVRTVATAAGFASVAVVECGFRQGQVAAVVALDLPVRSDESLYVEIRRT